MLSLILTIFCSTSIALILKHNDSNKGDPLMLLLGNYFVAALISFALFALGKRTGYSIETFLFGSVLGGMFVLSFFAFAKAVGSAGTALATVSSRLSVVVPVLLSMIVFREHPKINHIFGFLFTLSTIILFYFSLKKHAMGRLKFMDYFYLILVLLGIGFNDFAMKIFQQWRGQTEEPFFLMIIFGTAFIYTFMISLAKRKPFSKKTLFLGGILGLPNMFSTYFLLAALSVLPAIIVYPVVNIGIILLTSLLAFIIWKEQLNTYGMIAIVCGITALVFLSI